MNLLDWSSNNVLAVCLAYTLYLWNASTGEIQLLYEAEDENDIITSVQWMKKSPILAVGTTNKQIMLWDSEKFEKVSTINAHTNRVSSLAWNGNILTSGSLDAKILNHDVR